MGMGQHFGQHASKYSMRLKGRRRCVTSVATCRDKIVSGSEDGTIRMWDLSTGGQLQILHCARYATSSSRSACTCTCALRMPDETQSGSQGAVYSVACSPDETGLIVSFQMDESDPCHAARAIDVWDISTGNCIASLHGHTDVVNSIAFSPDSRQLVSGSRDGSVVVMGSVSTTTPSLSKRTSKHLLHSQLTASELPWR